MNKIKNNSLVEKYKSLSVQSRASIWFVFCNFILKAFNFLSAPIFTRLLSTDQYGVVATFTTYQQIMLIFATLELPIGAYTRGYIKYEKTIKQFTTSIILLSNITTILFLFICLLFEKQFEEYTSLGLNVLLLSFLVFLLQPAYNCWMVKNRFDYRYISVVIVTVVLAVLSFVLPIIGINYFGTSADVNIIITLLTSAIVYLPFYIRLLDIRSFIVDIEKCIAMWKYSIGFQLPLVLHSISFLVLGQSDRVMISRMVSSSSAAIYSVAYTMGSIAIVLQTSINQAFQPFRYQSLNNKEYKKIDESTRKLSVLMLGCILMFVLVAPEIFYLIFPKSYNEAIIIIPPIAASVFFMFMYSVFVDIESFYEKTRYVMYASIVCAIINIILNYYSILKIGYYACGYTTLISYFIFSIMHYFFMKKTCKSQGINEEIFDVKYIIAFEGIALVIGLAAAFLYKHNVPRYILIIGLIVVILALKKEIISVFQRIKSSEK